MIHLNIPELKNQLDLQADTIQINSHWNVLSMLV